MKTVRPRDPAQAAGGHARNAKFDVVEFSQLGRLRHQQFGESSTNITETNETQLKVFHMFTI